MSEFAYRAVDAQGRTREGAIEAASRALAIDRLARDGLTPTRLVARGKSLRKRLQEPVSLNGGISVKQLTAISRELARLISAGMPVDRALEIMSESHEVGKTANTLSKILARIKAGDALSDAFGNAARGLPAYYIPIIRTGEMVGELGGALERLASVMERRLKFRRKIVSSLIYPAILMVLLTITLIVVVSLVLPEFERIFSEAGAELPWSTNFVLVIGNGLRNGWWLMLLALFGLVLGGKAILQRPSIRLAVDHQLLSARWLGGILAAMDLTRYFRTLGTLVQQNVSLSHALPVAESTIRNHALQRLLSDIGTRVRGGARLGREIGSFSRCPPAPRQIVRIGDETGDLGRALDKAADILDDYLEVTTERFLAAFLPTVTLIVGGIIAAFIVSVLGGILSINDLAF